MSPLKKTQTWRYISSETINSKLLFFFCSGKMLKVGSWLLCILVYLVLVVNYASAQLWDINGEVNLCVSKLNCSACIRTPECAWCAQPVSLIWNTFKFNLVTTFQLCWIGFQNFWRYQISSLQSLFCFLQWAAKRCMSKWIHYKSWIRI